MSRYSLILNLMIALACAGAQSDEAASAQPATSSENPVADYPELWQLDWSVRSELPEFSVTGWLASDDASKRFARIDGEVYVEGDDLDNGLMLLEVKRHCLIFVFQGKTFRYYPR